ncbi:MAG: HesA/MoeB/ThiF family protein [Anaerolineaceae bacterium]|nr:HesA/MoeB/ThiF family protein [Anaerolineaceae bacterium]
MEPQRYKFNHNAISAEEQSVLKDKHVFVAGCGGLGGYVIESLARLGVGRITVVDGDVFEESNLNRQLLSSSMNLGKPKVRAAQQRIQAVNPLVSVDARQVFINEENASELIKGSDVVVDCLDTIPSRFVLQAAARKAGIPLVHGAVAGWYGHVCTIQPGEDTLNEIYGHSEAVKGIEGETGNLAFTVAYVASIQAAETVKLLLNRGSGIKGLLQVDLLNQVVENIPLL